jgi:hypothetical protein
MKQHFEDTLRVFSGVSKEKEKGENGDPLPEIKKRLKNVEAEGEILNLEEMIPEAARVSVFELQEKKQQIIQWIHKQFNNIEGKSVRSIHKKKEGQDDYYVDEKMNVEWNGETILVTKGLLATDGEWGNLYTLDQGVPRDVKKTFVVAEAKREMLHLLNQQEAHTETKREIPKWIDGTAKDILRSNQGNYAKS